MGNEVSPRPHVLLLSSCQLCERVVGFLLKSSKSVTHFSFPSSRQSDFFIDTFIARKGSTLLLLSCSLTVLRREL